MLENPEVANDFETFISRLKVEPAKESEGRAHALQRFPTRSAVNSKQHLFY